MPSPPRRVIIDIDLLATGDDDNDEAQVRFIQTVLSTWHGSDGFDDVLSAIRTETIAKFIHLLGPPRPNNPIRSAFVAYLSTVDALYNLRKIKD